MSSRLTQHAAIRCQQRGISPFVLQCLRDYGVEIHDHFGAVTRHFTRRSFRAMEREFGSETVRRLLRDKQRAYAVFGNGDSVITAGWLKHRVKR